jgi:phenylalanyl-tRNA synthetase beta chain
MFTSVAWLNDYLDPPASADEQAELATRAGFPLEGREDVALPTGADVRQDFEMTSNRGDCVCHVGLAREIAAISGRTLSVPRAAPPVAAAAAADLVRVTNRETTRCPLYTARIIRGVTVGPSPDWLAERLIARGDIPRNNVVDATNFVLFELGQPTHVFDLATLEGREIIIRMAQAGELFLPIGEGEAEVELTTDDLVIADAGRAVAIAGVKGGALTAVNEGTTDLLLEAATFDPVSVRNSSRHHGIASDSSYRFERGVHPGQIDAAATRLAQLILETAGGELCTGTVQDGAEIPERKSVSMRVERCRQLLGVPVTDEQMMDGLGRLGFEPSRNGDRIDCVAPVFRLDIEREIDLVEEVGRMYGHDRIPVTETISVRVTPPQPTELARQAVSNELVGLGFVETVTHSLVAEEAATPFLPAGAHLLLVDDERAGAESALQPSVLPGLLRVRRHNLDNGVDDLRLFEAAATFVGTGDTHDETVRLGLLMDVERDDDGLRPIRGVIGRLLEVVLDPGASFEVTADETTAWLAPGARVTVDGAPLGCFGRLAPAVAKRFGLDEPVLAAEVDIPRLYESYPPETEAHALPSFPAIERDLSPVLDESTRWADVEAAVGGLGLDRLESCDFVTTFRSTDLGAGRKSLTFRLRFRAPDRTLTHDEIDPAVERVMKTVEDALGGTFRR